MTVENKMEKLVALCKNRGYIFPGSEIYGGLANSWDYGPLGVEFKNNIKKAWWKKFIQESPYNVGMDAAILMNPRTWEVSGHVGSFNDPLMDCKECKTRFRADKLIEDYLSELGQEEEAVDGWTHDKMESYIKDNQLVCPDSSTNEEALEIIRKYNINVSKEVEELLNTETPDIISNVKTMITGSVTQLCTAAEGTCKELGYEPVVLTASLSCEAREAGSFLASIAQYHNTANKSLAFIAGGETVVHLKGSGRGGRNQELALSAAAGISELCDVAVFSIGSDGTDGPTDAAGGYVDTNTKNVLADKGIAIFDILENNDAYNGLKESGGLIITGPTGTNVNDLSVLLIKR